MLNETASSTEDRPGLRSSVRPMSGVDESQHSELREKVNTVLLIERESDEPPPPEQAGRDGVLLLGPESQFAATFEGRLRMDSEEAYTRLDALLQLDDALAVFREFDGRHVIHVIRGRVQVTPRNPWINIILFAVTVFSVLMVGTEHALSEIASVNMAQAERLAETFLLQLWRGLPYAISILLILGAHELGHYFAGRRHKLAVTLPYFIPAPFISFLGTFGAFIQLREPMRNRKVLLDVGAAGPLAGLVFAIPILFIGLKTSPVLPLPPVSSMEGNSLFYAFAKILVFGHFLPDGHVDVYINQLATAGWAGLLVTALNLIPIGQLDGGHVLFALVGRQARWLYWPLIAVAVLLAIQNSTWVLWVVLLLLFGRTHAAPLDMITPLDKRRRGVAIAALVLFVLLFVPIPLSYVQNGPPIPAPRNSVFLWPMLTALIVVTWQRLRRRF